MKIATRLLALVVVVGGAGPAHADDDDGPECGPKANHCFEPGWTLVSQDGLEFTGGELPVVMASRAGAGWESIEYGDEVAGARPWKTRVARADELRVGMLVALFERGTTAPGWADDARRDWKLVRVVDIAEARRGKVMVNGYGLVSTEAVRLVDGAALDPVVAGKRDAHFLAGEHWMVPCDGEAGFWCAALALRPAAGGKGPDRFLRLNDGRVVTGIKAVSTRVAGAADLTVGRKVLVAAHMAGSEYVPPADAGNALVDRWRALEITRAGGGFIQSGQLHVRADAARVVNR
jgi:hypothetical protein